MSDISQNALTLFLNEITIMIIFIWKPHFIVEIFYQIQFLNLIKIRSHVGLEKKLFKEVPPKLYAKSLEHPKGVPTVL